MSSKELTQFPVEEEYRKTGITPDDIADLRRWLETQPHLPSKYITDLDLILAFYSCDCSTGVTKQVLDLHYTLRTLLPAYFKERHFDDRMKMSLDVLLSTPLPTRTKEGYSIYYTRYMDLDYQRFFLADVFKLSIMVLDLWQYHEGTSPGIIFVVDQKGFSMGHISRFDLQNVQQYFYYLQEVMLVKLKGIHFINAPTFIDKFIMVLKPFMKKELLDMIGIHPPGSESIKSVLPLEALPKEAGGEYKSLQECKEDVISMVQAGESYFKNESLKRVTESLRPGKPKTMSDIFGGVEGSFKKLSID